MIDYEPQNTFETIVITELKSIKSSLCTHLKGHRKINFYLLGGTISLIVGLILIYAGK